MRRIALVLACLFLVAAPVADAKERKKKPSPKLVGDAIELRG